MLIWPCSNPGPPFYCFIIHGLKRDMRGEWSGNVGQT